MGAVHSKPSSDIEVADQDARIMELKRRDLTFDEIALELGISRATAHRGFHRALQRVPEPAVAAYRAMHLARLALMREVALGILSAKHVSISNGHVVSEIIGNDDDGNPIYGEPYEDDAVTLAAMATVVKLDEREAKLLGLDAKTEVNVSGAVRYEVVGLEAADAA